MRMASPTSALNFPSTIVRSRAVFSGRLCGTRCQAATPSAVKVLPQFSGLKRGITFQNPSITHRVISQPWYQGHHECPHWLNPQAAWKQEIVWTKVNISESKRATEQLVSLTLDISEVPELKAGFKKPGQFVQVKVGDSKPTFLAIASTPKAAESGSLEFLIKDVEGTTASQLCALPEGSEVEVSQVLGKGFPVDKVPEDKFSTIIIFATGSGISPIRSVIEHGFNADKRSDVRLYYGAFTAESMAYKERFPAWEASGVKVIPVYSDEGDNWTGERGFVQAAYERAPKIADPDNAGALLCGQKEMLEELTAVLTADGLSKDAILTNF